MTMMKALCGKGLRVGVVLGSAIAGIASATAPKPHEVQRSAAIKSDYEATWSAMIDVFADHQWKIDTIDKSSGIVSTGWLNLGDSADTYADCGSAPLANTVGTQVAFNVRVKEQDEGTSLTVNTKFRQLRSIGDNSAIVECQSKGTVEDLVNGEVAHAAASSHRQKAAPAVVAAAPRGFYCTSSAASATAGFCMRDKGACSTARDAVAVAVADIAECTLVESAWCFDDGRCAPTREACTEKRSKRAEGDPEPRDCAEVK